MDHRPKVRRRPLTREDLERMDIPQEFWRARIQECPENARPLLLAYGQRLPDMREKGIGLFLSAAPGVGTTGAACVLAKEARVQGFSTYFTTVWALREAIRNKVAFDNDMSVFERAQSVDFLVLDGLRMEDATEMILGRRALDEILAGRTTHHRLSVVTGRMNFGQLDDPKGPWRGFLQSGKLHFTLLTGPDRRAQQYRNLGNEILPKTPTAGRSAT